MYAAILVGDEKFNFYYDIYEKHGLFTEELLARTDFNGDCLAFAYFRIYQSDIPLMMRTAYMAEYVNQYTHETWPPYSKHQLKYLDINHLQPKVVELKDTVCEICMGEEDTRFLKTVCGHHIHVECYKMLSKE